MLNLKFLVILAISIVLFPLNAQALNVSLLGMADVSNVIESGQALGSQTGYGGGLLFGFPLLTRVIGFETGALFFNRSWTDTISTGNTISGQVLELPALLKINLKFLALGFGAYYSSNVNNLSDYAASGLHTRDYGLIVNAGFRLPLSHSLLMRVDALYNYGMSNVSSVAGNTMRYRDLQLLAGFTFVIRDHSSR